METKKKSWLDEMTWEEAAEAFKKTDVAVICTGACHPHGIAAPLGTDTFVAYGIGERIGQRSDAVVLPTIPFGYNQYHMDGFPGCINISKNTYHNFLLEICESLYEWGTRKLVWVNPHGTNVGVIEGVAYQVRAEKNMLSAIVTYGLAGVVNPDLAGYGSEGLVDETSMMMYLMPHTAHPERDSGFRGEYKQPFGPNLKVIGHGASSRGGVKFKNGVIRLLTTTKDISDTCAFAGSEKAWNMENCSRELGEAIIETASNYIVEFIEEYSKIKIPPPTKFP
jgi:creatinine amidohydrolase